jgi:hypothetical protein
VETSPFRRTRWHADAVVAHLSSTRHRALFDAELLAVQVSRIHVTLRHRNAWNDTTSSQYRGPGSLTVSRREAEDVAEGWRERGSWFVIHEVPVLLLGTQLGPVAIAEFHTKNSFANWNRNSAAARVLRIGASAGDAIRSLGRFGIDDDQWWHNDWTAAISPHSSINGRPVWLPEYVTPKPRGRFKTWASVNNGSTYRIGWREFRTEERAVGASAVVTVFRELNGADAVEQGETTYRAAYESWCADAHAGWLGDDEAGDRLRGAAAEEDQWRQPALEHARRAELTQETFQPAIEALLGDLFPPPRAEVLGRDGLHRVPLHRRPGTFDEAVRVIDDVIDSLHPWDGARIRERYLLWKQPPEPVGETDRDVVRWLLTSDWRGEALSQLVDGEDEE